MFEKTPGNVWEISGEFSGRFHGISEKIQEMSEKIPGKIPRDIYKDCRECYQRFRGNNETMKQKIF